MIYEGNIIELTQIYVTT